jgi:hypothetical protein
MSKRESIPGYPHLKASWVQTDRYGDLKLIEVNRASDGFLIGVAKTRNGAIVTNLFLGASK